MNLLFLYILRMVFQKNFDVRLEEALSFLLARPVRIGARVEASNRNVKIEIRSSYIYLPEIYLNAPISSRYIEFHSDGWVIFKLYLKYAIEHGVPGYLNHCSYHIRNACEASTNNCFIRALCLSVAAEGICDLIDSAQSSVDKDKLCAFRTDVSQFVASKPEHQDLKERLVGAMDNLGQEKPKDKLYQLSKSGHVNNKYIKNWSRLRNSSAHPK